MFAAALFLFYLARLAYIRHRSSAAESFSATHRMLMTLIKPQKAETGKKSARTSKNGVVFLFILIMQEKNQCCLQCLPLIPASFYGAVWRD